MADEHRIANVAKVAEEAFWTVVRQCFPEADTDINLADWANEFDSACRNVVRNWVAMNVREKTTERAAAVSVPPPVANPIT